MTVLLAFLVGGQTVVVFALGLHTYHLQKALAAKESLIRALRSSHDELQDAVGILIRCGSESASTDQRGDGRVH